MVINKSKVIIRPEKPSEHEEVNKLIFEAFTEQHNIEIGRFMMEHFIEERKKETFIPELSIVNVLNKAKEMGYGAVFLGGNPKLYARFGFEPSSTYGIYHKDREKWGDEGYMVCLLKSGALDGVTGTTYYYGG